MISKKCSTPNALFTTITNPKYIHSRRHTVRSAHGPGLHAEYPLERLPELRREYRVDDRIEGAIEVAQPQEDTGYGFRRLAGVADRLEHSYEEEGQPAGDEGTGDDGQGLGGFALALRLERLSRPARRGRRRRRRRRGRRRRRRRCHRGRHRRRRRRWYGCC